MDFRCPTEPPPGSLAGREVQGSSACLAAGCTDRRMAVAQKTGIPEWVTLVNGNMGTKTCVLRSDRLILSHSHVSAG